MIVAAAVVVCMGMYFVSLRRQPGSAGFDWTKFWVALGLIAGLAGLGPLALQSKWLQDHPLTAMVLTVAVILAAVLWLTMWGAKRKEARQGVR